MWGKRGWSNLHSGWGKRDSDSDEELDGYPTGMEKRAWQRLQVSELHVLISQMDSLSQIKHYFCVPLLKFPFVRHRTLKPENCIRRKLLAKTCSPVEKNCT